MTPDETLFLPAPQRKSSFRAKLPVSSSGMNVALCTSRNEKNESFTKRSSSTLLEMVLSTRFS
jgi:hypothetical protein